MGDGVSCMPLQHQQQHATEKALCGASNGNGLDSKLHKVADGAESKKKKKKVVVKVKKKVVKKVVRLVKKKVVGVGGAVKSELALDRVCNGVEGGEVEEGELGTLNELENVEFVKEKLPPPRQLPPPQRRSEIENGEVVCGRWRKENVENGRRGEHGLWRGGNGMKGEIEKGEFIPDRRHNGDMRKDDFDYNGRNHRYLSVRDKGWKMEHERTPVSGRYAGGDFFRKKELNRSWSWCRSQHGKSAPRWENEQERNIRLCSKIVDEDKNEHKNARIEHSNDRNLRHCSKILDEYKNEHSNGRNHSQVHISGNRLKRHGNDSESNDLKQHRDHAGFKSRRLSDDGFCQVYPEHYSHHSVERPYRNSSSKLLADKYSSRHHESFSARPGCDRYKCSPGHFERSPHGHAKYFYHKEHTRAHRSPHGRDEFPYSREKSPHRHEKSPYDRNGGRLRHLGHKVRSLADAEWSPQDLVQCHDRSDHTPNLVESSAPDQSRQNIHGETSSKTIPSEKPSSNHSCEDNEENHIQEESNLSIIDSLGERNEHDTNVPIDKVICGEPEKEQQSCSPIITSKASPCLEPPPEELPPEELLSMEEDMDICDTPPHVTVLSDSLSGKWVYLDYNGVEHGPSKLSDIKALVDDGVLMLDHFIKHLDSDRWLTVENAASPLAAPSFPSIVSESITQLVNPPEATGNLLADTGDTFQSGPANYLEMQAPLSQPILCSNDSVLASELLEELHINDRVGVLLEGYDVIPGRELEAIKEALQLNFAYANWEGLGGYEGFPWHDNCLSVECDSRIDLAPRESKSQLGLPSDNDNGFDFGAHGDLFSARWSSKGGDWMRNDDAQDRYCWKKHVLNNGFPLCQMPKSGCEDPRWPQKDDLYCPSHSSRLDLPFWAFCTDEWVDCSAVSKPVQTKLASVRGVSGDVLSVVRINACVVNDQGSYVSESHHKTRGKDRYHSRSAWPLSSTGDSKISSTEEDSQSKAVNDHSSQGSCSDVPQGHLCTVSDMKLHLGDWFYLDDSGQEGGPLSFSELQLLVDQGLVKQYSSAFRKCDNVWVPVASSAAISDAIVRSHRQSSPVSGECSGNQSKQTCGVSLCEPSTNANLFNSLHLQFVGYTRGKLHELVMKSYKSREIAAAINEVLDPWINARQPKKEIEKQICWKSGDSGSSKRAQMQFDDNQEDCDYEDVRLTIDKDESNFDDLCCDANVFGKESGISGSEAGSWGLLNDHMLARVFHFLRSDFKSLIFASMTCKHWMASVRFYREVSRQVNLSSLSNSCTDSVLWNIMNAFGKDKIKSIVLMGCTNITPGMLERILISFPGTTTIDIRGCSQFGELIPKFTNVNWIKSRSPYVAKIEEPHKIKSLKQITEQTSSVSKVSNLCVQDDFGELKDYFASVDRRDIKQLFRQNLYKRSKLYDARRSSSILSRDARTRRWSIKKSGTSYKRMEAFIASRLREIMKENCCEFFVPKVAEIEAKIKNGYYSGHGLSSVKEDIGRMCRDAIKAKNRGVASDMNRVIAVLIQLSTRLEESSKYVNDRDALVKLWGSDSRSEFCSNSSKTNERKYRSNGTLGDLDNVKYASDRKIRRHISKWNKRSMDSESETSDDLDESSKDDKSNSDITTSGTESDQEVHSESRICESRGDGNFTHDDGMDFITDEREWGARMTNASLVPPVTRKYDVIDEYVIVADEEDVWRKLQVSLPDDYAEKLSAQKNGTEESDMELPEVKDYKPRKQLGTEVIEQEVYGIDPYTHNLLLDSMPEELDWSLNEKHLFVEDILLQTLNKQVRYFTGIGNTPMSYPLQPVIEEIERCAEEACDLRMMRMCEGILKAIDSRPNDKYVAYRKGLGVVCNKEDGFDEDDFVVEFLGEVYPVWKWFEKQDGIRSLQKNCNDPAPEFYNIYLERPKGDADGYDLVVVDAMHKANYASRICHSCQPNCEAKVTAVDGHYQIGIYSVRKIQYGEEITFDYHSVTESKEEYEASVCLCGSQVCRGSYLNLTGEGAFEKVLKEWHGILDRHYLMLEACELNSVSEEDYNDLGRAGLGSCLLGGLPDWLVAYAARLVRFVNFERTKLPEEILKHNLEEKRKYFSDICLEVDRSDAEVQAEGVYNQRLQNLAVTLDKVRYVLRCIFGDPRKAPPPLEKLSPEAVVSFLWEGEDSFVEELLQCLAPHVEKSTLSDLKSRICARYPSSSEDIQKYVLKSLLWLRDEVRNLPCTYKCRHDAAADLIHIYAYTKNFFRIRDYQTITSPPVYISPLDLGPKYTDKLGAGFHEYRKIYGENYCLGQLIFWYNQSHSEPDCTLARASKGCLSLPDIGSFYAKFQKPSRHRVYGSRTVRSMLARMEKHPQRPWPKDRIWSFKNSPKILGSPMLDAVINNSPLDREMIHWLKHRRGIFQAMWDQ